MRVAEKITKYLKQHKLPYYGITPTELARKTGHLFYDKKRDLEHPTTNFYNALYILEQERIIIIDIKHNPRLIIPLI